MRCPPSASVAEAYSGDLGLTKLATTPYGRILVVPTWLVRREISKRLRLSHVALFLQCCRLCGGVRRVSCCVAEACVFETLFVWKAFLREPDLRWLAALIVVV